MATLDYFIISTQALSMVLFIGSVGYMIRLSKPELKSLARVNISVLTPALLFSQITKSLDRKTLGELWFVPVMYILLGFIGLEWTRFGGRFLRLPDGFKRLCMLAVYFSNVNSILIPIIKGISSSPDSKFLLRDADDTPEKMAGRAISYGMIIGIMNNLLRWSIGVAILSPPESSTAVESTTSLTTLEATSEPEEQTNETTHLLIGALPGQHVAKDSSLGAIRSIGKRIWHVVSPCMTPPLIGVAVAVLVVCIPPLQHMMLKKGTYAFSAWSAVETCGEACIPLTLLALGGQLSADRHSVASEVVLEYNAEQYVSRKKQNAGIVLVLVGRFLIVPMFSCATLIVVYLYVPWLIPLLQDDPVLFLTLAIVSATPPAVNLLTVAQKLGMFETEAARILTCAYILGIFVLSVEVSVFLWLASLIHA